MQDLRLIGVHEDGLHLLLASADGERFRVPLDDALRAAARQDRPRLGQLQIEMDGGLRPRDVQAMIRAGASAQEVSERAGWSVEKVHKYEGPILAERSHVADLAREVRLRSRGSGAGASTLSARVTERMRDRGVDPDTSSWDAWRLAETDHWVVSLTFAAGGRQRQAAWSFDPASRVVDAQDDEARWLSEEEPAAGPLTGAQATPTRATDVYDVEAEGGIERGRPPRTTTQREAPVDLMTAMRERSTVRGRRGGRRKSAPTSPTALPTGDHDGQTDALPIAEISFDPVLDPPPPPAHTHPDDDPDAGSPAGDLRVTTGASGAPDGGAGPDAQATSAPTGGEGDDEDRAVDDRAPGRDDDPAHDRLDVDDDADVDPSEPDDVAEAPAAPTAAKPPRPATPARKGRATVPSWDDIMFGGSRD